MKYLIVCAALLTLSGCTVGSTVTPATESTVINKYVDGDTTCYYILFSSHSSISCVKEKK